jgi:hypothetical protein
VGGNEKRKRGSVCVYLQILHGTDDELLEDERGAADEDALLDSVPVVDVDLEALDVVGLRYVEVVYLVPRRIVRVLTHLGALPRRSLDPSIDASVTML